MSIYLFKNLTKFNKIALKIKNFHQLFSNRFFLKLNFSGVFMRLSNL